MCSIKSMPSESIWQYFWVYFMVIIRLWTLYVWVNADGPTNAKSDMYVTYFTHWYVIANILKNRLAMKIHWNLSSFCIVSCWLRAQALTLGSSIDSGIIVSTVSRDQKGYKYQVNEPDPKLH